MTFTMWGGCPFFFFFSFLTKHCLPSPRLSCDYLGRRCCSQEGLCSHTLCPHGSFVLLVARGPQSTLQTRGSWPGIPQQEKCLTVFALLHEVVFQKAIMVEKAWVVEHGESMCGCSALCVPPHRSEEAQSLLERTVWCDCRSWSLCSTCVCQLLASWSFLHSSRQSSEDPTLVLTSEIHSCDIHKNLTVVKKHPVLLWSLFPGSERRLQAG